jgi:hypothetical protein
MADIDSKYEPDNADADISLPTPVDRDITQGEEARKPPDKINKLHSDCNIFTSLNSKFRDV